MSEVRTAKSGVTPSVDPAVYEYVRKQGMETPLTHMLAKTPELFPTARSIRVFLEPDVALEDYWFLVFEVRVPEVDYPDWQVRRVAKRSWEEEYFKGYPPPINRSMSLDLVAVKE